jgi:hypothetical protein
MERIWLKTESLEEIGVCTIFATENITDYAVWGYQFLAPSPIENRQ